MTTQPIQRRAAEVLTVDSLDISELTSGTITRLSVRLAEGPIAPICVPVLVARGRRPGPVLGLTAAVHGNELNGIPLIHTLMQRVDLKTLRGTIVAVPAVNPGGLARGDRHYIDNLDLNHLFPGKASGRGADVFAYRFIEQIGSVFEVLLDLHTASFGRINSLYVRADVRQAATADLAHLLRPQIVLHNAASDGTLRAAMEQRGVPSVTVEIGNPHRYHHEFIRSSLAGVRRVMAHLGMSPKRPQKPSDPPVLCRSSRWLYTDHGGFLSVLPAVTDRVRKGDVVARIVDAYGDLIHEYTAPHSGIVIGRSVNPVAHTGDRILHLGRLATAADQQLLMRGDFRTTVHDGSGDSVDAIAALRREEQGLS